MAEKISTATIKAGRDHDVPWIVVNGYPAEIRAQIIELLDFDEAAMKDYSTAQLVIEASLHFQALFAASKSLGAKPLPVATAATPDASGPTGQAAWGAGGDKPTPPWDGPKEEADPLVAALNNAATVAEIGDLWREHKTEFERPEVAAAAASARKRIDGGAA